MLQDTVNQLKARKAAIQNEIATLNAEDRQIDKTIEAINLLPPQTEGSIATPVTATKRTMSAATKAKMKAAQQARWAKVNHVTTPEAATPAPADVEAPATKSKISAATLAKMRLAAKARWVARRAKSAPVAATPEAKPAKTTKKTMSPLGKLRIKFGALTRYGRKAEAKQVLAQIAALEAKSKK